MYFIFSFISLCINFWTFADVATWPPSRSLLHVLLCICHNKLSSFFQFFFHLYVCVGGHLLFLSFLVAMDSIRGMVLSQTEAVWAALKSNGSTIWTVCFPSISCPPSSSSSFNHSFSSSLLENNEMRPIREFSYD
jgi:hypothetical protein